MSKITKNVFSFKFSGRHQCALAVLATVLPETNCAILNRAASIGQKQTKTSFHPSCQFLVQELLQIYRALLTILNSCLLGC